MASKGSVEVFVSLSVEDKEGRRSINIRMRLRMATHELASDWAEENKGPDLRRSLENFGYVWDCLECFFVSWYRQEVILKSVYSVAQLLHMSMIFLQEEKELPFLHIVCMEKANGSTQG